MTGRVSSPAGLQEIKQWLQIGFSADKQYSIRPLNVQDGVILFLEYDADARARSNPKIDLIMEDFQTGVGQVHCCPRLFWVLFVEFCQSFMVSRRKVGATTILEWLWRQISMSNWSSSSDKARKGLFKIKNAGKHVPTAQNEDLSAAPMVYRTA